MFGLNPVAAGVIAFEGERAFREKHGMPCRAWEDLSSLERKAWVMAGATLLITLKLLRRQVDK